MKSVETDKKPEGATCPIVGDQIGSTVYSERFVLRLLLKLSEPELPVDNSSFEKDLCVLWDMTAELDVVRFLVQHHFLEHLQFAWDRIPSPRMTEIFLGIVANMCCYPPAVSELRDSEQFCLTMVRLVHSDDSALLIQVMRVVKACIYEADAIESAHWLRLFTSADFTPAVAFILSYSSNKDLLVNTLETLNVICSSCNVETSRAEFVKQFLTHEITDGVPECIQELGVTQRSSCERDELERAFLVALQITMNLAGFDVSVKLYQEKSKIAAMLSVILEYYKDKIVNEIDVDSCLVDVFDSILIINDQLGLHNDGDTESSVILAYEMWLSLCSEKAKLTHEKCEFEESIDDELMRNLNKKFCCVICSFMTCCPEENFRSFFKIVETEFDEIMSVIEDENLSLHSALGKRITEIYINR